MCNIVIIIVINDNNDNTRNAYMCSSSRRPGPVRLRDIIQTELISSKMLRPTADDNPCDRTYVCNILEVLQLAHDGTVSLCGWSPANNFSRATFIWFFYSFWSHWNSKSKNHRASCLGVFFLAEEPIYDFDTYPKYFKSFGWVSVWLLKFRSHDVQCRHKEV